MTTEPGPQNRRAMTRDELTHRVLELFPPLARRRAVGLGRDRGGKAGAHGRKSTTTFTGLDSGDIDLTAPVPNTTRVGVWRIEPNNHYTLAGLGRRPDRDRGSRPSGPELAGSSPTCSRWRTRSPSTLGTPGSRHRSRLSRDACVPTPSSPWRRPYTRPTDAFDPWSTVMLRRCQSQPSAVGIGWRR